MKLGVPDRLRSGDLLHERQACCLDYTTRTEMERVNGIAPSSRPWHGRILLLNHTRKNGVPSRTLTDNLTLRTRPLCALSYGDKESNPGRSLPPAHTRHFLEALGRLSYFAFRSSKWCARPVTLRNPALI